MKRDFTMPENIQAVGEYQDTIRHIVYNYVLARTKNHCIAEEVVQDVFMHVMEHVHNNGSGAEIENFRGYVMRTARNVLVDMLKRGSLAAGGGGASKVDCLEVGAFDAVGTVAADDGAQPETRRMLEEILVAGGRQIVEQLKEQDSKIEAAACAQPEIGRLVDAHYIPLLLSVLALSDEQFEAEYPGESPISSKQRGALAEAIQEHAKGCSRCSAKFESDRQWEEHMDRVFSGAKRPPRLYV